LAGKGDLFGSDLDYDEAVIKSSCDVKSLTYCDLQCVHLNGLKDVLLMYPEFALRCAADLLHDLTYNLRDGFVEPDEDSHVIIPAVTLPSIVEETDDDHTDDDDIDDDDEEEEVEVDKEATSTDDEANTFDASDDDVNTSTLPRSPSSTDPPLAIARHTQSTSSPVDTRSALLVHNDRTR